MQIESRPLMIVVFLVQRLRTAKMLTG